MAKTAKPKTAIQIAADKARDALAAAKDRDAKGSNDTTKKAVEHAKTALAPALKAENRERFTGVGGGRVAKALSVLDTLKQIANRRTYEYSKADIDAAVNAIKAKLAEVEKTFETALATTPTAEKKAAPKAFKFE